MELINEKLKFPVGTMERDIEIPLKSRMSSRKQTFASLHTESQPERQKEAIPEMELVREFYFLFNHIRRQL